MSHVKGVKLIDWDVERSQSGGWLWRERAAVPTGRPFFHHFFWSTDARLTPDDHVTGLQLLVSPGVCQSQLMRQQRLKTARNSSWSSASLRASRLTEEERGTLTYCYRCKLVFAFIGFIFELLQTIWIWCGYGSYDDYLWRWGLFYPGFFKWFSFQ